MMRVAVPLFGQEVSPRFGCGGELLIASIENGTLQGTEVERTGELSFPQWPTFLASLNVAVLICGGIHHDLLREIERLGIKVYWGVIGPVSQALAALIDGTLRNDQFVGRSPKAPMITFPDDDRAGGHSA
ncbi:MAG: hypothetical protein JXQ73_01430 [Phycisphaerae bacterium]|nr:hypothetical protein [Phycisphaerae bacterium]